VNTRRIKGRETYKENNLKQEKRTSGCYDVR
jgi:hypothetical protein